MNINCFIVCACHFKPGSVRNLIIDQQIKSDTLFNFFLALTYLEAATERRISRAPASYESAFCCFIPYKTHLYKHIRE